MFHPDVVSERVSLLERKFGVRLYEYSVDDARYVSEVQLAAKWNPKLERYDGLTTDEQFFVQNELLMCRASFSYWFARYAKIVLDDASGAVGTPTVWQSQAIMLKRMGERELGYWQQYKLGQRRFDGNRWLIHKARQMGLSSVCEAIPTHAVNFYPNTNCLIGSKNLPKTQQVWRDYGRLMYVNMPEWMRVPHTSDHGERGLILANGSKVMLQHSEQESGFGQGAKWHRSHLTEIADWAPSTVSNQIDNHYDPACSRSISSAHFLESTSQGMDNYWHLNTERARAKRLGWWHYLFIPWWLVPQLYIQENAPEGWEPNEKTKAEAEKIERHSAEFNDGRTYRASKEQLCWWQQQHDSFQEKGLLNEFYKNYPSIPEDSFTHSGRSSFGYATLEWVSAQVREPYAYYDLAENIGNSERVRTESEVDPVTKRVVPAPPQYSVDGCGTIVPIHVTDEERLDPLGLILAWERPSDVAPYDTYASVDTTDGIQEWSRFLRKKGDDDINNACISILRSSLHVDTDVVEYAAPITPKPLARLHNILSRVWLGRNAIDGQVPSIIELTGDGMAFQEELISSWNFFAFYQHYEFTGGDWTETNKQGWTPSARAQRFLWSLFKSHVTDRLYIPRSRHLLREMRSCTDDMIYMAGMTRGKAPKYGGRHDDRVYSRAFAIWFANSMVAGGGEAKPQRNQTPQVTVQGRATPPLHLRDFGLQSTDAREEYMNNWEERMGSEVAGLSVGDLLKLSYEHKEKVYAVHQERERLRNEQRAAVRAANTRR